MYKRNGYISAKRKNIVFSHWSRKGYAIFASLGKVVKIATLKTTVSDCFILKCSSLKKDAGIAISEEEEKEYNLNSIHQQTESLSTFHLENLLTTLFTWRKNEFVCNSIRNISTQKKLKTTPYSTGHLATHNTGITSFMCFFFLYTCVVH